MKIRMTKDFSVAEDGVTVEFWKAGSEHDTNEQTAQLLVAINVAEPLEAMAQAVTSEDVQADLDKPTRRKKGVEDANSNMAATAAATIEQ